MIKDKGCIVIPVIVLLGCLGTLDFKIRYQDVAGLRTGDRVLFEERHIGDVQNVTYTNQGDYLVDVTVHKEFANEPTEKSRFYIGSDPDRKSRRAIYMVRSGSGGAPIKEGSVLAGTTEYAVLYDRLGASFHSSLERLESELNALVESLRRVPENQRLKRLEQELDRLLSELQHLGEDAKLKIKNEILPLIKEKVEELRRRLKEPGREEDLQQVDRKIETLSDALQI